MSLVKKYVLIGVSIGTLFFLTAITIDVLFSGNCEFSFSCFIETFFQIKSLWLIALGPVVFTYVGYLIGARNVRRIATFQKRFEAEKKRNEKITVFAKDISAGNYNSKIDSENKDDGLVLALNELRDNLKEAAEEQEKRKEEDERRNWATGGVAKFGDILRQRSNDIKEFGYQIITNLVKYTNSNQGGLYLINDDNEGDKHIELIAAYAYERRKYANKRIEIGDGLIGSCVYEKQTIYMTDIPDNYIEIRSGFGGASPGSLVIVPLKTEDGIFGVFELASFNEYSKHEIDFLEKVAESIASTISGVKVGIQTQKLLSQAKEQGEQLQQQEEEMRQNLEEMQATQEEASRRESEMRNVLSAIDAGTFRVEYDMEGNITDINQEFLDFVGISKHEAGKMNHKDGMDMSDDEYNEFWSKLKAGTIQKTVSKINVNGKAFTLSETYTPIYNDDGEVEKVLKIAFDVSNFVG